ncbi:MAG: hypothetical protein JWQ71_2593 [Pedosphaera sp.]|nr:hypothetical protein [Pedosphaera sp.]
MLALPPATNINLIQIGFLWNYNQSLKIYKCPSDPLKLFNSPTVRSYSLSAQMGGYASGKPWDSQGDPELHEQSGLSSRL